MNIMNTQSGESYKSMSKNKKYRKNMNENICSGQAGQEPEDVAGKRKVSAVLKNGQLENITKLGHKRSALSIEEMSKLKKADSFKKKF